MTQRIQARASHRFGLKPEQVYDAWLNPEKVKTWLSTSLKVGGLPGDVRQIQIEPHVGGKFLFSDFRNGKEVQHWGTYLELKSPHLIVFTWIVDASQESDPSKVTITLVPDGEGCVVTIVHEMDAAWIEYVPRTEQGWTRMLHAIEAMPHADC